MIAPSDPFAVTSVSRLCQHCGIEFEAMRTALYLQACCSDECTEAEKARLGLTPAKAAQTSDWDRICNAPRYARFDAAKLPPAAAKVMTAALSWRFSNRQDKGVGLIGPSDSGKSMLIHELARLQYEAGASVLVTSATDFAWKVGDLDQRRDFITDCIAVQVLLIDDIGKEKMTDRVESDLYHVLEQRERQLLPILFTANAKGTQLAEKMTEDRADPILNRLRRMAEIFTV